MRTAIYATFVAFLKLVTRVFFRRIEVVGREHVPDDGPVILIGNHPNSLIDPVLVTTTCGRRVSFAAKDTLFSTPLRPLLTALGAVPIRRRMDHKGDSSGAGVDNTAAFSALFDVLERGGAFGIFPEGVSHSSSELAPLRTGAARIALGAAAKGIPVRIVPCGLYYRRPDRARSRVLVQYGAPIVLGESWLAQYRVDESAAVRALTNALDQALRAQTINAPDFETIFVLDGVRRLYAPRSLELSLADQAEVMRRFIEHYGRLKSEPHVQALYDDVQAYLTTLDALGLHDRELERPPSRMAVAGRVVAHAFFALVLVPFAVPGLLLHFPILFLAMHTGEALTPRKDVVATTKMCVATLIVLLTYVAIAGAVATWLPHAYARPIGFAILFALVLSGVAALRVLERQAYIWQGARLFVRLVRLRAEIHALRDRRESLRGRVLSAVDAYLSADVVRVVPRGE